MPKGTALLLSTSVRPVMLDLLPWYANPRADELNAAIAAVTEQMTTAAGRAHRLLPI